MKKEQRKKKFLEVPEYPGGKTAFREFVAKNLQYPKEALKKQISGTVLLTAEIDHKGRVTGVKINKGIGYGCDEEAERVVKLMQFKPVKNRGVKITSRKKIRIGFHPPTSRKQSLAMQYHYQNTTIEDESQPDTTSEKPDTGNTPKTYEYTIKF